MFFGDWLVNNTDKACSKFTFIYIGEDCKSRPMIDIMREQNIFKNTIFASENIYNFDWKGGISSENWGILDTYKISDDNILILVDMCNSAYLHETTKACEKLRKNGRIPALISTNDRNIFYSEDFGDYYILLDSVPAHIIEIPEHRAKSINVPIELGHALKRLEDGYGGEESITIGAFIDSLHTQFTHY